MALLSEKIKNELGKLAKAAKMRVLNSEVDAFALRVGHEFEEKKARLELTQCTARVLEQLYKEQPGIFHLLTASKIRTAISDAADSKIPGVKDSLAALDKICVSMGLTLQHGIECAVATIVENTSLTESGNGVGISIGRTEPGGVSDTVMPLATLTLAFPNHSDYLKEECIAAVASANGSGAKSNGRASTNHGLNSLSPTNEGHGSTKHGYAGGDFMSSTKSLRRRTPGSNGFLEGAGGPSQKQKQVDIFQLTSIALNYLEKDFPYKFTSANAVETFSHNVCKANIFYSGENTQEDILSTTDFNFVLESKPGLKLQLQKIIQLASNLSDINLASNPQEYADAEYLLVNEHLSFHSAFEIQEIIQLVSNLSEIDSASNPQKHADAKLLLENALQSFHSVFKNQEVMQLVSNLSGINPTSDPQEYADAEDLLVNALQCFGGTVLNFVPSAQKGDVKNTLLQHKIWFGPLYPALTQKNKKRLSKAWGITFPDSNVTQTSKGNSLGNDKTVNCFLGAGPGQ